MAARILTLSGWGQAHDALSVLAPQATSVDYARHASVEEALAAIAAQAEGCDLAIGWSLGGQLLMRAMAMGMVHPQHVVLIAVPYQFVATPEWPLGMGRDTYKKFRDNY